MNPSHTPAVTDTVIQQETGLSLSDATEIYLVQKSPIVPLEPTRQIRVVVQNGGNGKQSRLDEQICWHVSHAGQTVVGVHSISDDGKEYGLGGVSCMRSPSILSSDQIWSSTQQSTPLSLRTGRGG